MSVTADGKVLVVNSRLNSAVYLYSLPDLKLLGGVDVGKAPDWVTHHAGQQIRLRRQCSVERRLRHRYQSDERSDANPGWASAEAQHHRDAPSRLGTTIRRSITPCRMSRCRSTAAGNLLTTFLSDAVAAMKSDKAIAGVRER